MSIDLRQRFHHVTNGQRNWFRTCSTTRRWNCLTTRRRTCSTNKIFQPTPNQFVTERDDLTRPVPNSFCEEHSSSDRTGRPVDTVTIQLNRKTTLEYVLSTKKRRKKNIADHDENHEPMMGNEAEVDFKFQDNHIPLWNTRTTPTFNNWFRKLRTLQLVNKIYDTFQSRIKQMIQDVGNIESRTETKTECTICSLHVQAFLTQRKRDESAIHQRWIFFQFQEVRNQEGTTMAISEKTETQGTLFFARNFHQPKSSENTDGSAHRKALTNAVPHTSPRAPFTHLGSASWQRKSTVSSDHRPPTSTNTTRQQAQGTCALCVCGPAKASPSLVAAPLVALPSMCKSDTIVVSMANWDPPKRGSPSFSRLPSGYMLLGQLCWL